MDPTELLKLLELDAADPLPPTDDGLSLAPAEPDPDARPTALDLDDWSVRRGDELLTDTPALRALDIDTPAAADFLAAAYLPDPRLVDACRDPLRHRFLARLLETPDYRTLHERTTLCEPAAMIGFTTAPGTSASRTHRMVFRFSRIFTRPNFSEPAERAGGLYVFIRGTAVQGKAS